MPVKTCLQEPGQRNVLFLRKLLSSCNFYIKFCGQKLAEKTEDITFAPTQ